MKICVRNNKTYEFIRWISAGEKLKDNEEIDSIELEKRNKNIDKKTFNAVEDLINITIMHLLHMGSSEEDNTKISMQLKEIDECISNFNEEQMRKLRYILLANDCKWCKVIPVRDFKSMLQFVKKIDDVLLIDNVSNKNELGKIIINKIKKFNKNNEEILNYFNNCEPDIVAQKYISKYDLKGEFNLCYCLFDLTNIKHKKSIKKFFKDEKVIRDKAKEEEYEAE